MLALGLLIAALWWLAGWLGGEQPPAEPLQQAPTLAVASAPVPATQAVAPASRPAAPASMPLPASSPGDDLAEHVPSGQVPTMAQVIAGLHERGIRTGLGAFNPPGTRPPLIGLAVPEDFELPPGYVRHYQATDDGQRIEAILMFSPDLKRFAADGRELSLPADRVVPPELAPPGLTIRRIQLPAPRAASAP